MSAGKTNHDVLLQRITRFYLESPQFNGIPFEQLQTEFETPKDRLIELLEHFIQGQLVSAVFGDTHPNPHVRALPDHPIETQVAKLRGPQLSQACIYPLATHLRRAVNPGDYQGRPYTLTLALGTPQLEFRPFDLRILEYYRNDPRYYYDNDSICGWISVKDDFIDSDKMEAKDQVLLKTFGFCYDGNLNRAVAVFVIRLSDLSAQHQQLWKANEVSGLYHLHPDYYRIQILGEWGQRMPVFDAFLEELRAINDMARAMGREPLFRHDYARKDRPREFGFLTRPTLRELNNFIHLLDKMISENMDVGFFGNDVPYESERTHKDGKTVVERRGTIAILEEWLRRAWQTKDRQPINRIVSTFKEVRTKRQRPAHEVEQDTFSQDYFREQRELMIRAYDAVRTLRVLLSRAPECAHVQVNEFIRDGKVWFR